MKTLTQTVSSLLAVATLTAGCAGLPGPGPGPLPPLPAAREPSAQAPTARDCQAIRGDIANAEAAKRAAAANEKDAWKAVIPFAVAAKYVSSKSAANQSDRQLERLRAELSAQGCEGSEQKQARR